MAELSLCNISNPPLRLPRQKTIQFYNVSILITTSASFSATSAPPIKVLSSRGGQWQGKRAIKTPCQLEYQMSSVEDRKLEILRGRASYRNNDKLTDTLQWISLTLIRKTLQPHLSWHIPKPNSGIHTGLPFSRT
jgi:hypothetical protein